MCTVTAAKSCPLYVGISLPVIGIIFHKFFRACLGFDEKFEHQLRNGNLGTNDERLRATVIRARNGYICGIGRDVLTIALVVAALVLAHSTQIVPGVLLVGVGAAIFLAVNSYQLHHAQKYLNNTQ